MRYLHRESEKYKLTQFVFLRVLGFVYFFAFLSLAHQVIPLIGDNGILPADLFLDRVQGNSSTSESFYKDHPIDAAWMKFSVILDKTWQEE